MYENIKEKINEYLKQHSKHSLLCMLNMHKLDFALEIVNCTSFLDNDATFKERIYCIFNNINKRQICPYCKKEPLKFKDMEVGYHPTCSISCGKLLAYSNEEHLKNSNTKRKETNLKKYGSLGATFGKASQSTKNSFKKEQEQYEQITDIYSKEETYNLLHSENFYYKQYIGKGNVRKLKRDNLKLYKSIILNTSQFRHMFYTYNFTASLLIIAELNYDVSKHLCKCGKHILYDPVSSSMYQNANKQCCYDTIPNLRLTCPHGGFSEKIYKRKYR